MLPLWPMISAAVIGPSPHTSVSEVPDAFTAAVTRRLETFIRAESSLIESIQ